MFTKIIFGHINLNKVILIFLAMYFSSAISTNAEEIELLAKKEILKISGKEAFIIMPKIIDKDKLIPWVWYAPTLKGLPAKEEFWMFNKFLEKGIAIAGINIGESYGSPAGRALYTTFHQHLIKNRGFKTKVCLLARSRGGLMLYNWAAENPKLINGIAGIYPVSNIKSYPGIKRACASYGMSEEELGQVIKEHNPIDRLAPLAKEKIPIFHIHGDKDKVVPLKDNSEILSKRYAKLGGTMTLKIIKDQGHNHWEGWFRNQELIDFMIKNSLK